MYNLFFDTSTKYLVMALFNENNLISHKIFNNNRKHSENAVEFLFDFLKLNNVNVSEIDAIYFTNGPGSFIGLRTLLTIIKTIKFCNLKIKLMSINTLLFLSNNEKSIVKINASKNKTYFAIYNNLNVIIEEQIVDNETFNDIIKSFSDYKIIDSFIAIDIQANFILHLNNFQFIENISDIKINYI